MKKISNLAKLGDGIDESPTVMVGDNNNNTATKLDWAFVETNRDFLNSCN